ncbi:MAG: hypothetical protein FJ087_14670 [Deltaproteobacteria bacterium]|nr:hypothetical protein [Deltaproteobacteria bacterium]
MSKTNFKSKAIKLPLDFNGLPPEHPFTGKDQKAPDAAALFVAPSTLGLHVDTTKTIGGQVEGLIDACADAVGQAFQQWQAGLKFAGVIINGPVGMAIPGGLIGVPLSGLIQGPTAGKCAGKQPSFVQHARAITNAIGTAMSAWQSTYMVTLTFPGGAICSTTMVPSPCTPMPVAAGSSPAGDAMLQPGALKGLMLANHGKPGNHTLDIYDAVAQAFCTIFTQWKAATQITGIMGAGGVAAVPPLPPTPVVMAIGNGGAVV